MPLNYDVIHADAAPQVLVGQMSAKHEREGMAEELRLIREKTSVPFVLCRVEVTDWDAQLSPWQAAPVFGNENFAGGAADTLQQLVQDILPALQEQYGELPICLAGYSLAGLFALWAATKNAQYETRQGQCQTRQYQCKTPQDQGETRQGHVSTQNETAIFQAVAAASPSVWYPAWMDYAEQHPLHAKAVYLSLGDKEDRSRSPLLREVSNCIRRQDEQLGAQGIKHILQWNEGNHFQNPELRTAKAIAWCLEQMAIFKLI